jgi:hypothetical protein
MAYELTDKEKLVYAKTVALAKSGKIEWLNAEWGRFGDLVIRAEPRRLIIIKDTGKGDKFIEVACFGYGEPQIIDDLSAIAKVQWELQQATLVDEYLALT